MNLIDSLSDNSISRKDKLLLILFSIDEPLHVKEIKSIAIKNGLRKVARWNISQILKGLEEEGLAVKIKHGWTMTIKGKSQTLSLGVAGANPRQNIQAELHNYLVQIKNDKIKGFAEETIIALEQGLLRAAVALSWSDAVFILYEEVLRNHLVAFNKEAKKGVGKWKDATSIDGLSKMTEHAFLQILPSLSIIGKNVKDELEGCLKLRNACSHPSSLEIGELRVASHVEILILNVYAKFTI